MAAITVCLLLWVTSSNVKLGKVKDRPPRCLTCTSSFIHITVIHLHAAILFIVNTLSFQLICCFY